MRIVSSMLISDLISNLNNTNQRIDDLQDQLSTGKRIRKPSDDPVDAAMALSQRTRQARLNQTARNDSAASDWMNSSGSMLAQLTATAQRVKELALQASSDTLGSTEKQRVSDELGQLMQHAVTIGNGNAGGRYLFAGTKTSTQPFSITAGPTTTIGYAGDTNDLLMRIDSGVTVPVNLTGNRVLAVMQSIADVYDATKTGGGPSAAQVAALDTSIDTTSSLQAALGAKSNRIESIQARSAEEHVQIATLLSETEEADIVDVTLRLKAQQNVYEAALSVGAKIIQPSLVQFLR